MKMRMKIIQIAIETAVSIVLKCAIRKHFHSHLPVERQALIFFTYLFLAFSVPLKAQDTIDSTQIYLRNAFIMDFQVNEFRVGNILMVNDLISKIEYGKSKSPLKGVLNYDAENKYLIPGLIDAHVHLGTDPSHSDNFEDTKERLNYLLQNGVTAVRDMAGDARYLNYLSRLALLDEIPAPDIYFSALFAGESFFKDPRTKLSAQGEKSGEASWMRAVNISSNFDLIVAEAKGTGATGIKVYANLDDTVVRQIVHAAHQQNMKVWAHATVFPAKPSEISHSGVDVLSHATLLAWEGVHDMPTNAFKRYKKQLDFDIQNPVFGALMDTLKNNETILDATVFIFHNKLDSTIFQQGIELTKLAYQNNIKIGVGTDMAINTSAEASPMIQEMKTLHNEVGMTLIDILRAATIVNAEMIGKEKDIGSITEGKKANILILNSNPLLNVANYSTIEYVIKNGKMYRNSNEN